MERIVHACLYFGFLTDNLSSYTMKILIEKIAIFLQKIYNIKTRNKKPNLMLKITYLYIGGTDEVKLYKWSAVYSRCPYLGSCPARII